MKKDELNPSATIQIDVQELDLEDPAIFEEVESKSGATPPPLPASALAPLAPPTAALAPQPPPIAAPSPRSNKPVVYGALFVALLAAAIFGGVKVGFALRAAPAPQASSAPAPPPGPSAESAPAIVSIPTVEFTDTPDAH
jgi:hypothetical protein